MQSYDIREISRFISGINLAPGCILPKQICVICGYDVNSRLATSPDPAAFVFGHRLADAADGMMKKIAAH